MSSVIGCPLLRGGARVQTLEFNGVCVREFRQNPSDPLEKKRVGPPDTAGVLQSSTRRSLTPSNLLSPISKANKTLAVFAPYTLVSVDVALDGSYSKFADTKCQP